MNAPHRPSEHDADTRNDALGRAALTVVAIALAVRLVLLLLGPTVSGIGILTAVGCIAAIVLAAIALRRRRAPLLPAIALGAAGAVLAGDLFYGIWTAL